MSIRESRRVSLWEKDAIDSLLVGIRIAPGTAEYEDVGQQLSSSPQADFCANGLPAFSPTRPVTDAELKCSHCNSSFSSRQEQVEHYRLDWHQFNLQRSIVGKAPLSEEQYANYSSGDSSDSETDGESSSGEEDDEDDEDDDKNNPDEESVNQVLGRHARIYFVNTDGLVISLYKRVLFGKKCAIEGEREVIQRVQGVTTNQLWAVILLGGGHFAAGIFKGSEVVMHKTFHNYTVRAKQGGSQKGKDGQSGTSHPKSSGASLRRYNELSQRQHVQELLQSWKGELARCRLIFYHAKHHNRSTLFTGKNQILDSSDTRLRTIPFPTKKATFKEVRRVYGLLSEVHVHGTEEEFNSMISESAPKVVKTFVKKKDQSPSKKPKRKPKTERKDSPVRASSPESEAESEGDIVLITSNLTLSTASLGGSIDECTPNVREKARRNKNKKARKSNKKETKKTNNQENKNKMNDMIYSACKSGDLDQLSKLLSEPPQALRGDVPEVTNKSEEKTLLDNIAQITFGGRNKTLLHVAAENGHKDIIWWLLEKGSDPVISDNQGQLPIKASKNKDTLDHFRRFLAQHPEKYDYERAEIFAPLTQEQEDELAALKAHRKKAKKEAQQEKQRKKQAEEKAKKEEEEERERFMNLSDREKRALAAERRLRENQKAKEEPIKVAQRCFSCATNISDIVPFEYNDFKFCSTKCVREHRSKNS